MHHGVGIRFLLSVGVLFLALTVGEILTALVVHNIVGNIHRRCVVGGNSLTVHGDTLVGQLNAHALIDLLGVVKHLGSRRISTRRLGRRGGRLCVIVCLLLRLFAAACSQYHSQNQY